MTRGVAIVAGLVLALAAAPAAHAATLDVPSSAGSVRVDSAQLSGGGVLRIRSSKAVTLTVPGKRLLVVRASIRSRVPVTLTHAGPIEIGASGSIDAPGVKLKGDTLRVEGAVSSPGGTITALGRRVDLAGATLDVSHPRGGGSVFVGDRRLTRYTTVDRASVIDADASRGKGGHIELWSSTRTSMRGSATASGRRGGFVETSSTGVIDTGYAQYDLTGRTIDAGGRLVFDPTNITVVAGNGTVNNSGPPTFTPSGPGSQIGADLISTQLSAGTAVTLDTTPDNSEPGHITVSSAITSASAAQLTLDADATIVLNANITAGALSMTAASGISQTGGALDIAGATSATSTGAGISLNRSGNDFGGAVAVTSSGAGAATVVDANDVTLGSSSSGGALSATAQDDLTVPAAATVAATGALTLVADNQNPAAPGIGTGGITIGANAALTGAGAVRMYAARRGDNLISGSATFNGSTYLPGPLFIDSARERWGVYSPGGTATAPFTFFYKDADTSVPVATITTPADGARYERGQVVNAAYTCGAAAEAPA